MMASQLISGFSSSSIT
jgi:hypothetical protein